ncbi:hypothetical protein Riv7116_3388 [Rivularia sp. PCC 7116]|nr:hypothetical protein Riv7116_3388 [Rivularia sp. PCC 7116]
MHLHEALPLVWEGRAFCYGFPAGDWEPVNQLRLEIIQLFLLFRRINVIIK